MDITVLRSVFTLLAALSFFGIVVWAVARRNQTRFDAAAQLPFDGDIT
jgi:cytochrome c oxidase cbb3-type subunit IV